MLQENVRTGTLSSKAATAQRAQFEGDRSKFLYQLCKYFKFNLKGELLPITLNELKTAWQKEKAAAKSNAEADQTSEGSR